MPDRRRHRGPHPDDRSLFGIDSLDPLRQAVVDYSWLLSRGYAAHATLSLVGNRHRLQSRQRTALQRMACSDAELGSRRANQTRLEGATGQLLIDGFNLLITIESALGGAVVLHCRDGCYRDLAGLRGTYRIVQETVPAVQAIGRTLSQSPSTGVIWLFDRPVSNSGRVAALVGEVGEAHGWNWEVRTHADVDTMLIGAPALIASADSRILDAGVRWTNLAAQVVADAVPDAWVVST